MSKQQVLTLVVGSCGAVVAWAGRIRMGLVGMPAVMYAAVAVASTAMIAAAVASAASVAATAAATEVQLRQQQLV